MAHFYNRRVQVWAHRLPGRVLSRRYMGGFVPPVGAIDMLLMNVANDLTSPLDDAVIRPFPARWRQRTSADDNLFLYHWLLEHVAF